MNSPMPQAWADLLEALMILARHHQDNAVSPTHCSHDTLCVMANPADCTAGELTRLDELGFIPDYDDGVFLSYRFGSA